MILGILHKCGTENAQGASFCKNCGNPISAASGSLPPAMSSTPQPTVKYCQKCGAANDAGVAYCQKCGEMHFGPVAPMKVSRPTGVTILGILQIVGSLFALAPGLGVAAFLGPLGLIIIPLAILPMVFAIALFTGRNWARILMLIGAVLDIISIVGIIWGAILLWYLTRPRVVAYFKQPK